MSQKISVVIERGAKGYYAFCPELPGCQSEVESYEAVLAHIREASELYLETLTPKERKTFLSREILTASLEVAAA
ncbi:MAG: type II toxin-antitoxin system HicB family antitoxin [Pedosphaera sp.]|nr:type II toxin-antitoxin system HicB family antitoxin [Pedosphaera sp.]MSS99853.1 type II toxin-antitoxin system HicB family antitoxin [Pedosphaera sp.]